MYITGGINGDDNIKANVEIVIINKLKEWFTCKSEKP